MAFDIRVSKNTITMHYHYMCAKKHTNAWYFDIHFKVCNLYIYDMCPIIMVIPGYFIIHLRVCKNAMACVQKIMVIVWYFDILQRMSKKKTTLSLCVQKQYHGTLICILQSTSKNIIALPLYYICRRISVYLIHSLRPIIPWYVSKIHSNTMVTYFHICFKVCPQNYDNTMVMSTFFLFIRLPSEWLFVLRRLYRPACYQSQI